MTQAKSFEKQTSRSPLRFTALVFSSVVLTACATGPYAPPPPDAAAPPRAESKAVERPAPPPASSTKAPTSSKPKASQTIAKGVRTERSRPSAAAQAMIEKAREARQSGDLAQAAGLLERAQRMSPQAAEVYYELAAVKMAANAHAQAEQLCQKALSLAGDDARFRADVWQRIADIREAQETSVVPRKPERMHAVAAER